MAPNGRVIDSLLKGALVMRDGFGAAPEPQLRAKVVPSLPARSAHSTRHSNLEGNPVAKGKSCHLRPDGNYHAGRLMTEREWMASAEVAIGKLLIV